MRPAFRARWVPWLRRGAQTAFLLLFVWLLLRTRSRDPEPPEGFLRFFFDINPLIALMTWVATRALPRAIGLAVATVLVTALLGRIFCGWICPLGTLHDAVSRLGNLLRSRLPKPNPWSPWQRSKYYLLAGLLVIAALGGQWVGVFDPIALVYRSAVTVLLPAAQYAIEKSGTAVHEADPHVGPLHATAVTEPVYRFFRDRIFVRRSQAFLQNNSIAAFLAIILLLNLYRRRFWCRYVCPLGALLGLFAVRPLLRLVNNRELCTHCGRCSLNCQGAASPEEPGEWRPWECFVCWNCSAACNPGAIQFTLAGPLRAATAARLDLSKRAVLSAGVGGVAGFLFFRLSPQAQARTYNPDLIRPPGACEENEFLRRCMKCGLCMKACPTTALHPTGLEAGVEGLWTPRLVPKIGYCEYNCNLCGQVCPTEAIQPLPIEEKRTVKIGLATVDTTRCLPYAYERQCIVCEEHCPLPNKAIYAVEKEILTRDGRTLRLLQPHVDPALCIGCGICENVCPFEDRAAIRVTSANESRHEGNQPILGGHFTTGRQRRRRRGRASSRPPQEISNGPYN